MSGRVWALIGATILVGAMQFITSCFLKTGAATSEKEKQETKVFKKWGIRSLVFSVLISPAYYFFEDIAIVVIAVYGLVLVANGFILKYGISKVEAIYTAKSKLEENSEGKESEDIKSSKESSEKEEK
ncbi:MAG: hypothetical protein PHR33_00490 [Bacilli bacterium]|nr:hypothetical protein [Bacilli bacterium]